MNSIIEKTQSHQFFILYDNMNFYENVCNQRLFNCNALLNYTTRYISFIKTNHYIKDDAESYKKLYINNSQIDRKLVNELINGDFNLI